MAIWIGVDEAGYGPNLGPLVICATVWETDSAFAKDDWAVRLSAMVRRANDEAEECDERLVVDDSKLVYQSGKGFGALERSVLALFGLCGAMFRDTNELRSWLDVDQALAEVFWRQPIAGRVPCASRDCIGAEALQALKHSMEAAGIQIQRAAAKHVFPKEFNQRLEKRDNKAAVLSEATMELVCELLRSIESDEVLVHCDKHGGRDRYYALLTHFFADERIEILREGEEESAYRWRNEQGRVEIRFCAKGERHLPTAAASMTAKYVREICMAEWNAFWQARIPGIEPTAGYPLDARRFRRVIESHIKDLGWEESHYWRSK